MRGNWTQAVSWIVCWGGKLLGDDNSKCSRPGLVASLARPGGNITGPELNTKRLEVIKDAVPKLARLGFLRDVQAGATLTLELKELRATARALKVDLEDIETAAEAKSIERAFQAQPAPAWPCSSVQLRSYRPISRTGLLL
jgi:hypothetical protein